MKIVWDKVALFIGGIVCGTAGIKVLGSKDAKKAYTHTTAAVLRAKECVMTSVTKVKENADDILAEAKEINETRSEMENEIIDDAACQAKACDNADSDNQ